jgi:hypothetical protein
VRKVGNLDSALCKVVKVFAQKELLCSIYCTVHFKFLVSIKCWNKVLNQVYMVDDKSPLSFTVVNIKPNWTLKKVQVLTKVVQSFPDLVRC